MAVQNFEEKNARIRARFNDLKKNGRERLRKRLNLSWSNWGFGMESLEKSAERLSGAGIEFIELHGNQYGDDLGYGADGTVKILRDQNLKVSGICGMFSAENDLSSTSGAARQRAIDYVKRTIRFAADVDGDYVLVAPGAVGRSEAYDESEFDRSAETLRLVGGLFVQHGVKAAIEPIRAAEVSFCHTIADAKRYIEKVGHRGVQHINGDIYHMQVEESHIGEAILEAGKRLTNLHIADSNRCALGRGSLDLDTVIMSLYLIEYNRPGCYVTPEPLGPGGDPYPAMFGKPDADLLDDLVNQTVAYFRERERCVLGA